MPTLNPQALNDEEYAMLKSIKERMKARSWKDLWILLAQYYDGTEGHTLTKEQAAKLITDLEKEKETEKEMIKTSEIDEVKARLSALEKAPAPVAESRPRMTKEDIIRHLETCTDANCEYRMIAQAARELDRVKEPDTSKGALIVGDKTFPMDQQEAAENYAKEFAKAHDNKVDVFYRKGTFKSEGFDHYLGCNMHEDFERGIKNALRDLRKS